MLSVSKHAPIFFNNLLNLELRQPLDEERILEVSDRWYSIAVD